jgi:hypothetical protein
MGMGRRITFVLKFPEGKIHYLRRNDIHNRFEAELNRYQRFRVYRARFDQPDAL